MTQKDNAMSVEKAKELRTQYYPAEVLCGEVAPNLEQRTRLVDACVKAKLPILSAGRAVGKVPSSPKDKNWRGRALEVYLGGHNSARAERDFDDGELKSTRVLGSPGRWEIEQTLRITTLSHADDAHNKRFEETPLYQKISCFICVLFDSQKVDIDSGNFVGAFLFKINHHRDFLGHIKEDYEFYTKEILKGPRVTSRVQSPKGFLRCRQTAGKAGAISATSLYITKTKFDELLAFYKVNQ